MDKKNKDQLETLRVPLRIVFYKDDDTTVVAHCLEFDLIGHGDTHEQAIESLCNAINIQVEETLETGNVENLFNPAPGEYFRMFAAGQSSQRVGKAVGEVKIKIHHIGNMDFNEVDGREYVGSDQHDDMCAAV